MTIKKKSLKEKIDKKAFEPTHIKFNFSFISYDKDFTNEHKIKFVDRLIEISKEPYIVVAGWNKEKGFEIENLKISKTINSNFFSGNNREFNGKYTIIRLYPNNNPLPSRVIGVMINKVFYVLFIDIYGKLYNH